MSKTLRWIVGSVVFWLLLNLVALHELVHSSDVAEIPLGQRRNKLVVPSRRGPPQHMIKRNDESSSDDSIGSGHIEAEDSSSDDGSSGSGDTLAAHLVTGGRTSIVAAVPPTKHPKPKSGGGKDSIPRSIGNSVVAAHTETVRIKMVVDHNDVDPALTFLIVGDWGGPGRQPQRNVAHAMDQIATSSKDHNIHFVISTGDNMYEDGVSGVKDRKFKRNFEDVYTQPSLQCRWYMSLGNHDHGAHGVMRDAQAEVNYTTVSRRWFLPSTYYAQEFVVESDSSSSSSFRLLLVVLDTYDYSPRVTQMTETQLRWFESTLSRSTADVKIVVGHRPLFSAGAKHGSSPYMQKKLEPVMVKYGVSAYLCGDDHELQVMQSKGVVHLLSGGGSRAKKDLKPNGIAQTVFQAGVNGFMWVAVKRSSLQVEVYNQHAEKLFDKAFPTATTTRLAQ